MIISATLKDFETASGRVADIVMRENMILANVTLPALFAAHGSVPFAAFMSLMAAGVGMGIGYFRMACAVDGNAQLQSARKKGVVPTVSAQQVYDRYLPRALGWSTGAQMAVTAGALFLR